MFSKFAKIILVASAMVANVCASPVGLATRSSHGHDISFNHWGGISSLDGFDNFYGVENFGGYVSSQVLVKQEKELVCHRQSIEIVQQRLLVLQEMAKRIITEQVCEVETQTIAFEQFHFSLGLFRGDLLHRSGRHVGYDSGIVSHFHDFFEADGSLSTRDFGFSGHDLGKQTIVVGGSNWDDRFSPVTVYYAQNLARTAIFHDGSFSVLG
ncbi:hypothetical protein D9613_005920 [Agrocybe pediades]|uniref:Uncharacterized protein n=1 Tax=Agrocybe pediades TaxID=84607 RepID=A0A8H4QUT9_9AGAR|nr:hypothetical protein D9613_005920 [Agrocybe pediades]